MLLRYCGNPSAVIEFETYGSRFTLVNLLIRNFTQTRIVIYLLNVSCCRKMQIFSGTYWNFFCWCSYKRTVYKCVHMQFDKWRALINNRWCFSSYWIRIQDPSSTNTRKCVFLCNFVISLRTLSVFFFYLFSPAIDLFLMFQCSK